MTLICTSQKVSKQWRYYSFIISSWSFSKLVDVRLSFSNKVCLPLIEARLLFFWSPSHFLLCLQGASNPFSFGVLFSTFENSIDMTLHNDMILSTLSLSSRGFALGFSKKPHTNRDSIIWLYKVENIISLWRVVLI